MRLVIQEFRHVGIQFSLIALLTMAYFLLVRLVTWYGWQLKTFNGTNRGRTRPATLKWDPTAVRGFTKNAGDAYTQFLYLSL